MLLDTLGIWPGVLHADSNPSAHAVKPTKSYGGAQCFSVSASADKHALTMVAEKGHPPAAPPNRPPRAAQRPPMAALGAACCRPRRQLKIVIT